MNKLLKKVITIILSVTMLATCIAFASGCYYIHDLSVYDTIINMGGSAGGDGTGDGSTGGGTGGGDETPGDDEDEDVSTGGVTIESIQAKYDADLYTDVPGKVTISMAHHDNEGANKEKQILQILLRAFKNRYPNITVTLDIISEYETTYTTRLATSPHDVYAVPDGVFKQWYATGKMLNLTQLINSSDILDLGGMYDSVVTRFQNNGVQYVIPRDISTHVMYYNKDYFDEMGVAYPAKNHRMTVDEAVTMWKALTKKDSGTGKITTYGNVGLGIEGLVWSAGGDFMNPARNGYPTDTNTINGLTKAYQFMQDAYFTHNVLVPSKEIGAMTSSTFFSQQRVATLIDGSWNMATFRNLDFDWDITYVPAFTDNPNENGWSGSVGYAINSALNQTPRGLAAWKLVEYIGSPEGQEILSATGFQFPLYESLGLDEDYIATQASFKPANYDVFIKSAMHQPAGTWTYRSSSRWKVETYDEFSALLLDDNDRITVADFLNRVRNAIPGKL